MSTGRRGRLKLDRQLGSLAVRIGRTRYVIESAPRMKRIVVRAIGSHEAEPVLGQVRRCRAEQVVDRIAGIPRNARAGWLKRRDSRRVARPLIAVIR